MTQPAALVRVEDVFVAFPAAAGPVMALRGTDLVVEAGERLLVRGPNGSGKSTLLRVITGEQPVTAGTVRVDGVPLHTLAVARRQRWRARTVGFLDQHPQRALLPELSVLDNVALQLRLVGVRAAEARERARQTLAELDVAWLATRAVPELSGGEAQRVAICAAVAHRPRLVLADEPTGELDEHAAREVHDLLSRIAASGTSVILVSHDPRSTTFADRMIRLRDGRVAEQWTARSGRVEPVPDPRGWVRPPPALPDPVSRGDGPDETSSGPPRVEPARRSAAPTAGDEPPLLALAGVVAGYPGVPLFTGLDLTVRPGELVAVTGSSGTGKSTLLSLAAGLVDAEAGSVRVGPAGWDGLDRSVRAELRRGRLALLTQRPSLVETLTVRENLRLTADIRGVAGSTEDLVEVADRLGLGALLDQPVDRLSGGERQRAALARCLVSGVALLLLDEPTSQQDEASTRRVILVLAEEVAAGRAVLAASHDPRLTAAASRTVHLGR